ncbi:MAG: alpha-L-fucosidase [Verrucomicrobia bacterium]|nr:alpha-L-fucosidase [Verrucomicrobiota bacterium]
MKTPMAIAFLAAVPCLLAQQPPAPFPPLPNPAQLRWHKAECIMFANFGMKTFYPSNDHMGYGKEDPKRFNPVKFDAKQWVEAAKAGGFKGIVLTTKHHDGFCNWRTDTTGHSVKSATWRDGSGDVVRELADACRKGGMYFGLYVSIIDKHFESAGSPKHATYGDYYFDQIKELSTRYGPIDEYWFDGFNADKLRMDYPKIGRMIAETQPNAVIYDSGMLVKSLPDRCIAWPGAHGGIKPEQNYRKEVDGTTRWYPNEPSIILQGNWFHNGQPAVGLKAMQDYYLTSVGCGVTPLMNIPPNADGLIDADTIVRLKEFKAWVEKLHASDAARDAKATDTGHRANNPQFAADKANDGNYDTYFATDDNATTAVIELDLGGTRKIDGFILQEYIPLGQRVNGYTIECRANGKWEPAFAGKTIGYKRIILAGRGSAAETKFPDADAVRLRITNSLAPPLINNIHVISETAK